MTTHTDELSNPEVQRLLRDSLLLRLGYNGTDGTPRVIPIGYFWNGGEVVICTATTSPKVRALGEAADSGLGRVPSPLLDIMSLIGE